MTSANPSGSLNARHALRSHARLRVLTPAVAPFNRQLQRFRQRLISAPPAVPVRYGITVLAVVLIALLRFIFFAGFPAWFVFIPAVLVIALFLGGGCGLLASLLATANAAYVLLALEPAHGVAPSHWAAAVLFGLTNISLVGLAVALRRALATDDGTVVVHWQIDESEPMARFHLTWHEHGGPPVQQPTRRGFGSTLIERSLRSYFGGTAVTDYKPDGLVFTLDAPFDKAALASGHA